MTVEDIPADENVVMTDIMHRAFNAAGCDPMCHCCEKMIPVDSNFKLSTIVEAPIKWGEAACFQKEVLLGNLNATPKDYSKFFGYTIREEYKDWDTKKLKEGAEKFRLVSKEVMLCENCNPKTFMIKELQALEKDIKRMEAPKGGCFRVNGKIVH